MCRGAGGQAMRLGTCGQGTLTCRLASGTVSSVMQCRSKVGMECRNTSTQSESDTLQFSASGIRRAHAGSGPPCLA